VPARPSGPTGGRIDLDDCTTSAALVNEGSGSNPAASAHAATVARALANANTPDQAVRAAIRLCADGFKVRAAVWTRNTEDERMRLVGVWGLGRSGRARVQAAIPFAPSEPTAMVRRSMKRRFAELTFAEQVAAVDAGGSLLLIADVPAECLPMVDAAAGLLADALARIEREHQEQQTADLGIAVTAHELRGPLLAARVALERLVDPDADLSQVLGLILRAERELDQSSRRMESLLRWSSGTLRMQKARTDLTRLVHDAVGTCALEHGRERTRVKTPERISVRADPVLLRSAIENVVRNALVYSPRESGVLACAYVTKAGRPTVTVRDHGPGVAHADAAALFQPFVRGRASSGRPGAGLGLFVAKRVVEAHGGDISLRPASDGRGTVCRIRLPEGTIA
jgi:signal transduction histidine kinase